MGVVGDDDGEGGDCEAVNGLSAEVVIRHGLAVGDAGGEEGAGAADGDEVNGAEFLESGADLKGARAFADRGAEAGAEEG